jgi:dTDP-4-amino-4,6-dideoxygalactose transaminase
MRKIEMVDLKAQYRKIKQEIDRAIQEVVDSAAFIGGRPIQDFADELEAYLDAERVIPCANGTDALQISMMALGLQPGDEVICPSFTYFATVEVIALLKLTPVFIDVNPETFNVEASEVEKAITPKTKAIVPVHLYGQSANMEEIMAVANRHNLPVIEDNAQAIGGDFIFSDGRVKKTGTIGLIGCTSFFPSKNLGCYGDGGAMMTNDDGLGERLKMIANHGQRVRYYHDLVGVNSRLDTIQAAVLRVKLKHLNEYIEARRRAADYYDRAFDGHPKIKTPFRARYAHHVFHQYTIKVDERRDELVEYLKGKEIPAMIYYPVACDQQKAFEGKGRTVGDLKHTRWLSERVLSLPMHTELDEEQLDYITKAVLSFYK